MQGDSKERIPAIKTIGIDIFPKKSCAYSLLYSCIFFIFSGSSNCENAKGITRSNNKKMSNIFPFAINYLMAAAPAASFLAAFFNCFLVLFQAAFIAEPFSVLFNSLAFLFLHPAYG